MGGALALGPMSIPALGWRRLGVLAAACLAAIGVVYFLQPESDRRWAPDSLIVDGVPSSLAGRSNVRAPGISVNREGPASTGQAHPAEIPNTASAAQARPELNAAKMSAPSAGGRTSQRPGTASAGASRDSNASSAAYTPANDASSRSNAPPELDGAQLASRANVSQSALAADGAQALASAMEKCGKEAFLSRFICEEKMYMQYCADKWEKDPRCMRRTASN